MIPGPWQEHRCFWYDFFADECFSVTKEDLLTEQDVYDYWEAVEAADLKEITSFVKHEVFRLDLASNSTNTIDAVWVRKWASRNPMVIKSWCCGRGFLDVQKKHVNNHSPTASQMSHRLGMTYAVQHGWDV